MSGPLLVPTLVQAGVPVAGAVVVVKGRDKDLVTSTRGECRRLLVPGSYTVWAHSGGRRSREVTVTVKERLLQVSFSFRLSVLELPRKHLTVRDQTWLKPLCRLMAGRTCRDTWWGG